MNYVDYIKSQIKRLQTIEKYEKKRDTAKKPSTKDYYTAGMKLLLEQGETLENYKQVLSEYENALVIRKDRIDKLYKEIKIIKKLKV